MKKSILKIKTALQAHPARLLFVAACLHLTVTTVIFLIGRFQLMPSQFDRNGVGEFAADGRMHQLDAFMLSSKLGSEGLRAWLTAVAPLHVRLYSLSHVLMERTIGANILSVEPMNLLYYLAILAMVYKLGEAVFDRRAGLVAATVVAIWPTLLLHTTQPLRDPLLITLVVSLLLIITRWITNTFSWWESIVAGLVGALVLLTIWIVRLAMWDSARAVVGLALVVLFIRLIKERRLLITNLVTGAILIPALWIIPQGNQLLQFTEKREPDSGRVLIGEKVIDMSLWERVATRRDGFIDRQYDSDYRAGSDVDTDVRFHDEGDVIRYLPRAAAIGLFAPFPNMWFARGLLVGRAGRSLAGVEMLFTYVIEGFAAIGIWRKRKQLSIWLLVSSAIMGITALGLIVVNIGSLYRLRYPYWILLVILGAGGAVQVFSGLCNRHERKPGAGTL